MPGITITTAVRTGPVNSGVAPAATFFITGQTERGNDTAPVLVTSLPDYETKFGVHTTGHYTWYSLKTFFEEGGVSAYVARATAAAAVNSVKALVVAVADPGITLTAVGAGTWGNNLTVVVDETTGTFVVTVAYSGTEVFSGSFTSLQGAIDGINSSLDAAKYFTAALTTAASPTAVLSDLASSAFASGTNGSIAKSDFIAALDLFGPELGAGAVSAPGVATGTSDAALYDALRTHAQANNRIAICGFASDATLAQSKTASTGYTGTQYHEYMGFYHPWVTIPNDSVNVSVPAEGYVAGTRARAHNAAGPWKAYAGVASEAVFVNGTTIAVSRSDGDLMESSRVNPLRIINGRVRVYGARSHSTEVAQWRFITLRDTVNYVVVECEKRLEDLVFSTIDGRQTLFANIIGAIRTVLEPIRIAGGLYEGFSSDGRRTDYGYLVTCDASINPNSQLEAGTVKARVGLRCASIGDKIEVEIIKSNLTTALA